jgi:PAS domain S-box-containing protein
MFRRLVGSLLFRLTIVALTATVLLGITSSMFLYVQVRQSLYDLMEKNAHALAAELDYAVTSLLNHEDSVAVQRIVERTSVLEDVQDIVIVDYTGRVIAAKNYTALTGKGGPSYAEYGLAWTDVTTVMERGINQAAYGPSAFAVVAPLRGVTYDRARQTNVTGAIIVQMRLASVETRLNTELGLRGWLNVLLIALISFVMVPAVYVMVVRPLDQAVRATRQIAAGNFDTRLPVRGADEIHALAAAFNRMAGDLELHIRQLTTLYAISSTISTTLDLDEMLTYIANHLAQLIDATGTFILQWDTTRQVPVSHAAYGDYNRVYQTLVIQPGEPTLTRAVIQAKQPIAVFDVFNSPHISPRIAAQFPDKSLLGIPLIANGIVIGAALIGESRRQREFTTAEINLMMSVAGQIASAIHNAQLFAELTTERNRLNGIFNTVSDAIILTDQEWRARFLNPAFNTVTRFDPNVMLGKSIWSLVVADEAELFALQENFRATWSEGGAWRRQISMRGANDLIFDADLAIAPIREPGIAPVGYVASIRDITELKELDRMKTRFVSNVSHELRTPLSVIALYAENLSGFYNHLADAQRQDIVRDIYAEAITLHQLIEQLLQLSRLDADKAEPQRAHFDLGELITEAVHRAQRQAQTKQIELTLGLPGAPVMIFADRAQLLQVCHNLLSNACKFTPEGGKVWVTLEHHRETATLEVRDTGIGVPPEDIAHLFERFYRGKLAVTREIRGTGLGLAIAHEIVTRHRGSIVVDSVREHGTTFRVQLPLT